MAKGNDKKVVKEARALLLSALGNLLESHRERRFTYSQKAKPLPRRLFCARNQRDPAIVTAIETGRFLSLNFSHLRNYLATTYGRNDTEFTESARKVYDGLKELEAFLKEL